MQIPLFFVSFKLWAWRSFCLEMGVDGMRRKEIRTQKRTLVDWLEEGRQGRRETKEEPAEK